MRTPFNLKRLEPWAWAARYVPADPTSPFPGLWNPDISPWCREPMEAFADNSIEQLSAVCSIQSGKTQMLEALACWRLSEVPGTMLWVSATDDDAQRFHRERLRPTMEGCDPVGALLSTDRHENNLGEVILPFGSLLFRGAQAEHGLQSVPISCLLLDEARNYPEGAMEMVSGRTTAFWYSKTFIISTPGVEGDAVDIAWRAGDQREYHCDPGCGHKNPLKWSQLKWTENTDTRPGDHDGITAGWDFDKVAQTIYYECPDCGYSVKDIPSDRWRIARSGVWVPHNPTAPKNKRSYRWSALLPPWIPYRRLVELWLLAQQSKRRGVLAPLQCFLAERMADCWRQVMDDDLPVVRPQVTDGGYTIDDAVSVSEGDPKADYRFMTVDWQVRSFWIVVRDWWRNGDSRLLWEGEVRSIKDVRELQLKYKVLDRLVFNDSGYNAVEVYRRCVEFGWTATKGEGRDFYTHTLKSGAVRRLYSELQRGDPGMNTAHKGRQTYAPLFLFASNALKDILQRLRDGQGARWQLPDDVTDEYLRQIRSEVKTEVVNKVTGQVTWRWVRIRKANHLFDAEVLQILAAHLAGIINIDPADNAALTGH